MFNRIFYFIYFIFFSSQIDLSQNILRQRCSSDLLLVYSPLEIPLINGSSERKWMFSRFKDIHSKIELKVQSSCTSLVRLATNAFVSLNYYSLQNHVRSMYKMNSCSKFIISSVSRGKLIQICT